MQTPKFLSNALPSRFVAGALLVDPEQDLPEEIVNLVQVFRTVELDPMFLVRPEAINTKHEEKNIVLDAVQVEGVPYLYNRYPRFGVSGMLLSSLFWVTNVPVLVAKVSDFSGLNVSEAVQQVQQLLEVANIEQPIAHWGSHASFPMASVWPSGEAKKLLMWMKKNGNLRKYLEQK